MLMTRWAVIEVPANELPVVLGVFDTLVQAGEFIVKNVNDGKRVILQPLTVTNTVNLFNHTSARIGGDWTVTMGNERLTTAGEWTKFDGNKAPEERHTFKAQLAAIDAAVASLKTVTVHVHQTLSDSLDNFTLYYKDGVPQAHN